MLVLAAAIILSLNSSDMINKANDAKNSNDLLAAKNAAVIAQSEWELMDETERSNWATVNSEGKTVKAYVESKLATLELLEGYVVNSKGEVSIAATSIIERVEQIKSEKGDITNWDDISIKQKNSGTVYTDKGFKVDYNGEIYTYVYDTNGDYYSNGNYLFNYNPLYALLGNQSELYETNEYSNKIIVEVPEGVTYIGGGTFNSNIYAVIFPESLTIFDGGLFYGPATNLKEIKINGILTSITGSGIKEGEVSNTCSVFYKNKKMTLLEFSGLFS